MNILTHRGHVNSQVQIIFAGGGWLATQGDRIAQVRRLLSVILGRDVGQKEMAEMVGVSHAYMGHVETGHRAGYLGGPKRSDSGFLVSPEYKAAIPRTVLSTCAAG